MRNFAKILGAIFLLASFSCKTEKQKLMIAAREGTYSKVIKSCTREFEKKNGCKIEILDFSFDALHDFIVFDAPLPKGSADLILVDSSWMREFVDKKILTNLSEMGYEFDDDIIPSTTSICCSQGDIFLVPYYGNVTILLYNRAALNVTGFTVESLSSLDVLLLVAQKSKEMGLKGFIYRGDQGNNIVSDFLPILLAFGGWIIDDNLNPTIDSPIFRSAMEYFIKLDETGGAVGEREKIMGEINSGSAVLTIGWPGWVVPTSSSPAAYTEVPVSATKGGKKFATSEYGTWTLGITANSENKELALKLLQHIIDPQVQLDSVSKGGVPCRYSVLRNKTVLKENPHYEIVCNALENGVYRPSIVQWAEFSDILGSEMKNILCAKKTLDEGLASAQKKLTHLMSKSKEFP